MKKSKPKKRSLYLFLIISYVAILFLTLSSNLLFFSRVNSQITEKNETTNELLLQQSRVRWEKNVGEMEKLANKVAFSTELDRYVKGIQVKTASELQSQLLNVRGNDADFVMDKFVYIKETNEIINPTIRMDAYAFFKIMYGIDNKELIDKILLTENRFNEYMPLTELEHYGEKAVRVIPYVQSFPVKKNQPQLGLVIAFINADLILEEVEQLRITTNSDVYIFNPKWGFYLTNSHHIVADDIITDTELLRELVPIKNLVVSYQDTENSGWRFVLAAPQSLYRLENKNFLMWAVMISLIYLVIGLVLIRFLAERGYGPVREINKLILSKNNEELGHKNELDLIKYTLMNQYQSHDVMENLLDIQKPIVVKEMMARLISGMVKDYSVWEGHLSEIGVELETRDFYVITADVEESSKFFELGKPEESLLLARLIVQNVGTELYSEGFECFYMETARTRCTFLLNAKNNENDLCCVISNKTSQLVEVANDFDLDIHVGTSTRYTGLKSVPIAYDESRKALEHSMLWGDVPVVSYDALKDTDFDYYYPSEAEFQLVSFLRSGNYPQAKELVNNIFATNRTEKNISINAALGLITEVSSTLNRVLSSVTMGSKNLNDSAFSLDNYIQNPSMEIAQVDLNRMIDSIGEQQTESTTKNKTEHLVDSIATFISANVENPSLDLNFLSQEFQVTPQYISNIFKQYKKENFRDFVSRLRFEKAKELLRTTDLSVNEIAQQLGYAGEIGIIRLFKRYEDITPGEYRSTYR